MAEEFKIKVEGLDELEQMLQKRVPQEAKTALRRAIRKATELFRAAISAKAPVYDGPPATRKGGVPVVPGELRDSIDIKTMATGGDDDDTTGGVIGISGPDKDVYWALWQEMGSVKQEAKPFIRPAFDENAQSAITIFEEELRKQLEAMEKS